MVDDGLSGGVDPRHPPHTDEHVVDEVHWYKVCYPKLAVSADSQHSLSNLCKVRREDMERRRGEKKGGRREEERGERHGEEERGEEGGGEGGRRGEEGRRGKEGRREEEEGEE